MAVFAIGARAQLRLASSFTANSGLVSLGFSDATDRLWSYSSFASSLNSYSRSGVAGMSVSRGGEAANDADLDVASVSFKLGSTTIPAGTLLFINGEKGAADIYGIDPSTGAVLASLTSQFGLSHVVGGAYHAGRGTFFLVQDRVPPGAANKNLIAEVDPQTGAVLASFQVAAPFTVNYGDLDINSITGNLFLVSSDEKVIRELTPAGVLVRDHPIPVTVNNLSGIAIDESRATIWLSGGNKVWELSGLPSASAEVYGTPSSGTLTYSWLMPPPGGLPSAGNAGFSVVVVAPGMNNPGVMILSAAPADLQLFGMRILVDFNLSFTVPGQVVPSVAVSLPIPSALAPGTKLYLQSFHFDAGAPAGIASTAGLRLVVYP